MAWFGKSVKSLRASGVAHSKKGQHDRAIADFDEAIRLDPKDAVSFGARGHAYFIKGDYDRAIADFDEAIRLDPKNAVSFGVRGDAYFKKGDYDRAIADFDEAIRLDPQRAVSFVGRGYAYSVKGNYNRAIADINEAIRLDPKNALSFVGRGMAYGNKGQHDRAIADFDEAIRLDPNFTEAIEIRAKAIARRKELGGEISAEALRTSGIDETFAAAKNGSALSSILSTLNHLQANVLRAVAEAPDPSKAAEAAIRQIEDSEARCQRYEADGQRLLALCKKISDRIGGASVICNKENGEVFVHPDLAREFETPGNEGLKERLHRVMNTGGQHGTHGN